MFKLTRIIGAVLIIFGLAVFGLAAVLWAMYLSNVVPLLLLASILFFGGVCALITEKE